MISMPSRELDAGGSRGLAARAPRGRPGSRVPRPWLHEGAAARITCSSSPSAKTTRLGWRRTPLEDALQRRRRSGRAAADSCCAIGVHVDDRLARDAGVHRRLGDRERDMSEIRRGSNGAGMM